MNEMLKKDLDTISSILGEIQETSIDFLTQLNEIPTSPQDRNINPSVLRNKGLGTKETLAYFNATYKKLMVSSSGPRYWGYVIGGVTPAALAGDWLSSVFDQNSQGVQGNGDLSAILEVQTMKHMMELFGLPDHFHGGFVSGATMSNFTCLAVARQWAGALSGKDIAREGMSSDLVVLSAKPHSSVLKSLSMLGFGSNKIIQVDVVPGREQIDVKDLEQKLKQFKGKPVILSCSSGTVNTVDFDNLAEISDLKKKYSFWMHVDAAFGGFAACSENYAHLLNGWENADSITIDCHKWMNVPYDSAVFLTRKEHQKLQIQTFQNTNAPYLGDPEENFSYMNFLPENSRRFRALPAWFSMMAYGREGFQWIVENSIRCASALENYLQSSERFQLSAPVHLNVVCFNLKDKSRTSAFLSKLNGRGKVFMTPTVMGDQLCIRAAFVNYRTTDDDIKIAIQEMEEVVNSL
jgi:glutamate/tyrosine decarboxylase-like PLP-dependent enzyme